MPNENGASIPVGLVADRGGCACGEKATSGGYNSNQAVQGADETISSDGGTWSVLIFNFDSQPATGNLDVVCLK